MPNYDDDSKKTYKNKNQGMIIHFQWKHVFQIKTKEPTFKELIYIEWVEQMDMIKNKKAERRIHYRILKKGGETNFDKAFDTPCCSISQIDEILKDDNKWVNS